MKKERKRGRRNEGWVAPFVEGGPLYAHFKYKGKRYCESAGSFLVKDAQRVLDRMRRELLAGTYVPPRQRARLKRAEKLSTVEKMAEQWLETRIKAARNETGRQLAQSRVTNYLVPYFGSKAVAEIGKGDVRAYRLWLEAHKDEHDRKISPTTVGHVLSDARNFLLWCEDEGFITRSPFPRGIMPKVQERAPKALSDDDATKLAGIPDPYGFAVRMMLGCGVRWGELVRLQASDVKDGRLQVEARRRRSSVASPVPGAPQGTKRPRRALGPLRRRPGLFRLHQGRSEALRPRYVRRSSATTHVRRSLARRGRLPRRTPACTRPLLD